MHSLLIMGVCLLLGNLGGFIQPEKEVRLSRQRRPKLKWGDKRRLASNTAGLDEQDIAPTMMGGDTGGSKVISANFLISI